MQYCAESNRSPEEILSALAALGDAKPTTWASEHARSPSRLYCRVDATTFEASIGAGSVLAAAMCSGTVQPRVHGCLVSAAFRFGVLPAFAFRLVFVTTLLSALLIVLCGAADLEDPLQLALVLGLPVSAALYSWLKSREVLLLLSELSDQAGGLAWSKAR